MKITINKIFSLLMSAAVLICFAVSLSSCDEISGPYERDKNGIYYELNADGDGYSVVDCEFKGSTLNIPSTYKDLPVTEIGGYAFSDCAALTSITFPDSIVKIVPGAFYGCTGITSITVPAGVTNIDGTVFSGCTNLEKLEVASGNKVLHSEGNCIIETSAKTLKAGCKGSMVPNDGSVTKIGMSAFLGCTGLANITIPDGVTEIGNGAFYGCTGLKGVTVPDSVTKIASSAFYGCTDLTSIRIPESVAEIGGAAFADCGKLENIEVASGNKIFYSKDNCIIETATKTLVTGCKSSKVPNDGSVTSIANSAFEGCTGITSIYIPATIEKIGDAAFAKCINIESIEVSKENKVFHSDGNCIIETSTKTLNAGCKSSVIPNDGSVTKIGNSAFKDCTGLKGVTIPDSVTEIGMSAFFGCTSLTSIAIPNGVKEIGFGAFCRCTGLTSITIPDGVTEIGRLVFDSCTGLTSVTIPDGVTKIGDMAFSSCKVLKGITIPESVTEIGHMAFTNCTALSNIDYNGTKEQWDNINKPADWCAKTGDYTVHCTDGDIKKQS